MSTSKTIAGLVVLAVVVVGGILLITNKSDSTTSYSSNSSQKTSGSTGAAKSTADSASTQPAATAAGTITYTASGFQPSVLTIKVGDTVTITNSSGHPLQFQSDPHPTHTNEPELNVGNVDSGHSATFKVTKMGSWGYHNHLNTSDTGTIKVQ